MYDTSPLLLSPCFALCHLVWQRNLKLHKLRCFVVSCKEMQKTHSVRNGGHNFSFDYRKPCLCLIKTAFFCVDKSRQGHGMTSRGFSLSIFIFYSYFLTVPREYMFFDFCEVYGNKMVSKLINYYTPQKLFKNQCPQLSGISGM